MPKLPVQIAKVIVDVPTLPPLDYAIPDSMLVAPGDRVMVNLRSRVLPGIVATVGDNSEVEFSRLRAIREVFKDTAPLSKEWMALTRFASQYYVRGWGEVALAALPSWLKQAPTARREGRLEKLRLALQDELRALKSDLANKPVIHKPTLNPDQRAAYEAIVSKTGFQTFMLYGVTGSGKTEVYLQVIEQTLARDPEAQVLLLVPEINLTPQLESRVRDRFPAQLVVSMHSSLSEGDRAKAWLATHEGYARVVIGTRLSIFSSFKKLGLVIVDEEHDPSFKAGDGSRFSARDLAIWRGMKNQCSVILGSATPSSETWAKTMEGKYQLLELPGRAATGSDLPTLIFNPNPPRDSESAFHALTLEKMKETLEKGRQVLVFLNRRGYAASVSCPACNWVSTCDHCSTFTVFHKHLYQLICHHCGTSKPVPKKCPNCGNVDILPKGYGTEKVQEELTTLFPEHPNLRIDRDTTTSRAQAEQAFKKVHQGQVDILVGTQMIAKGHDFQNVGLVVVLNADGQLLSPEIRARELLFATLMQVAGRAGRSGERGEVIIQTQMPHDALFGALANQNYREFADPLLEERKANTSVPYVYQALLTVRATNLQDCMFFLDRARDKALALNVPDILVYSPVPMSILKLMDEERAQLLIESEDRIALNRFLWDWLPELHECGDQNWTIEVDPVSI